MEQKYTLNEIILEAMRRFELPDDEIPKMKDKNEPTFQKKTQLETNMAKTKKEIPPERYRKKFETYVKTEKNKSGKTLWDASVDRTYKRSNSKTFHFFTKQQMEDILYSDIIYDYCITNSSSDKIKSSRTRKELQKLVDEEKRKWDEIKQEPDMTGLFGGGTVPTETDFYIEKSMIMLEALFELFFEPINGELLQKDMVNSSYYGGDTETAESMESKLRHSDFHNYYSIREKANSILDPILDILADKIANRMKNSLPKK